MEPGRFDFKFRRGSTFEMYLRIQDYVVDPDTGDITLGDYADLTGAIFMGQLRELSSDTNPIAEFSFTLDDQVSAATRGGVTVRLNYLDTQKFPLGDFEYDILVEQDGRRDPYLEGIATCRPGVTR